MNSGRLKRQLFKVGELSNALDKAIEEDKNIAEALDNPNSDNSRVVPLTDEASAMERQGHEPLLVEALQPNFKITRPVDLTIANALLNVEVHPS